MNKKILFVVPSRGFGGAEIHTVTLAKHLATSGYQCDFCFPVLLETVQLLELCDSEGFGVINVSIDPKPAASNVEAFEQQRLALSAGAKLQEYVFVFIASPSPYTGMGVMAALAQAEVPGAIIFHLAHDSLTYSYAERAYLHSVKREHIKMVCVSEFTRDRVASAAGLDEEELLVIENGIRLDRSVFDAQEEVCLSEQLGRSGSKIVLTSGRLHPQKGVATLLETIKEICSNRGDVHFVIVGDGPSKQDIEAFLDKNSLRSFVSLFGFVEKPYRFFRQADVLALPTLYEGLSLTLLEALHSGACILTTDASYQDRILNHGEDAWLVPVADSKEFSRALDALLDNDDLRHRLRNGAARKAERFREEVMLSEYLALVESRGLSVLPSAGDEITTSILVDFSAQSGVLVTVRKDEQSNGMALSQLLLGETSLVLSAGEHVIVEARGVGSDVKVRYTTADDEGVLICLMNAVEQYELKSGCEFPQFWACLVQELIEGQVSRLHTVAWRQFIKHAQRFGAAKNGSLIAVLDAYDAIDSAAQSEVAAYLRSFAFRERSGGLAEVVANRVLGERGGAGRGVYPQPPFLATRGQRRVLIFMPSFVVPAHNGSSARCYQVIRAYRAHGFEVEVVSFGVNPVSDVRTKAMLQAELGVDFHIIERSENTKRVHAEGYAAIARGDLGAANFFTTDVANWFRNFALAFDPDVVHINYVYFSWLSGFVSPSVRKVLDTHDLISRRARLMSELKQYCADQVKVVWDVRTNVFQRAAIKNFNVMNFDLDTMELQGFDCFDCVVFISREEMSWAAGACSNVTSVCLPYLPEPDRRSRTNQCHGEVRAIYSGGANALNIVGLAAAVRLLPRLKMLADGFRLWVVGRVGEAVGTQNGLIRWGYVDNANGLIQCAQFAISAQPCGTGQSIKVADAIAQGLPNVVFAPVAEGAMVEHGVNGLIASDLEEYYGYCRELVLDGATLNRLRSSTREWATDCMGQQVFNEKFEAVIGG